MSMITQNKRQVTVLLCLGIFLFFYSCFCTGENFRPDGAPVKQANAEYLVKLIEHEKFPDKPEKPSDPIWALLLEYSPDAYFLARRTEELPDTIKIGTSFTSTKTSSSGTRTTTGSDGKTTETILDGSGLKRWIQTDKSFFEQVKDISTAVHEENHEFTNTSALYLLSRKVRSEREMSVYSSDGTRSFILYLDAFYLDRNNTIYAPRRSLTHLQYPAFGAGKLEILIPEELRTFRYKTYINKESHHSCQQSGISGLLDEYNSYYWSNKVIFDLFEYYKTINPQSAKTWLDWTGEVLGHYFAWAEFRYWILTYILYAEKFEPKIYASIMEDRLMRNAFTVIDDRFTGLVNKLFLRLGKELPELLVNYGIKITVGEGITTMNGKKTESLRYQFGAVSQGMYSHFYTPLVDAMNTPQYTAAGNTFRLTPQGPLPGLDTFMKLIQESKK
ncbi:MAG: hypothetical protein JW904_05155 [Spirochaetales bacterium]|nr:hypothetical protein [Spirochaetales bacterium]